MPLPLAFVQRRDAAAAALIGAEGFVRRTDRGRLTGKTWRTPQGYLGSLGYAAREGILEYDDGAGGIRRELVTADVLTDPESIASLGSAPLTLLHPTEDVTPDNVQTYQVGDIGHEIALENGFVVVRLITRRKDALAALTSDDPEIRADELSCGYAAQYDPTPGEHPIFGHYDGRQTKRIYNHLAIVPAGRAGPACRVYLDAAAQITPFPAPASRSPLGEKSMKNFLSLLKAGAMAEAVAALVAAEVPPADAEEIVGMYKRVPEMEIEISDLGTEMETVKMDARKKADELAAILAGQKADRIAYASERAPLLTMADAAKIDRKTSDALDNDELRKSIVLARNAKARTDASPEYYRAYLDATTGDQVRTDADTDPNAAAGQQFAAASREDRSRDTKPLPEADRADKAWMAANPNHPKTIAYNAARAGV